MASNLYIGDFDMCDYRFMHSRAVRERRCTACGCGPLEGISGLCDVCYVQAWHELDPAKYSHAAGRPNLSASTVYVLRTHPGLSGRVW